MDKSPKVFYEIIHHYVMQQLIEFKRGPRCCKQFSATFRSSERAIFEEYAKSLGYHTRPHVQNGMQTIKVFKLSCLHYFEHPPMLRLDENTKKDMCLLLRAVNFLGSKSDVHMEPDFFSPAIVRPSLPPHWFAMNVKQEIAPNCVYGQLSFQQECRLQPFKQKILEAISRNRVVIVNGPVSFDKSTGIPMYLLERCAENGTHYKAICVEREELFAIYNSEILAKHLEEKVGQTVAYQVRLQSCISESSNIIYTTGNFLLRTLIGQSTADGFRHISHVIISDVHLHDPYVDLLLCELRTALRYQPQLKVILLMHTRLFLSYLYYLESFGEAVEIDLAATPETLRNLPDIYYLEDVHKMIANDRVVCPVSKPRESTPKVLREYDNNRVHLDRLLDTYEQKPNDSSFNDFLYMILGELAPINYRHSATGTTIITLAARLGKAEHVDRLLNMHADPFLKDIHNENAISAALTSNNIHVAELINQFCSSGQTPITFDPYFFDYGLIVDLIRILLTRSKWTLGNILVLLPSYEHGLRLNFSLLRHKMAGRLVQNISVSLLHSDIDKEDMDELIKPARDFVKIIIATDTAETINFLKDITYVIDSGRIQSHVYNAVSCCSEYKMEWMSHTRFENRTSLINSEQGIFGACFRLVPSALFGFLPLAPKIPLQAMPLDRVCLMAKLLSPHKMVCDYLAGLLEPPPLINILHSIEELRKIEVFNENEDVSWLGVRLLDLPVSCHLGKMLVHAVMMRCIDPILTIVSFLSVSEPHELPPYVNGNPDPFIVAVRHRIKDERNRLSAGTYSDHLIYLKLYQDWQNSFRDDGPDLALQDENKFVLDGILEKVWYMRTALVAALRSAQLIHTQGILSMHNINRFSNSWAIIKAALVAGSYPTICATDMPQPQRIKSNSALELVLYPTTSLRELPLIPLATFAKDFPSQWIAYSKQTNSGRYNNISCCTVVGPLLIALFAGPSKLYPTNIVPRYDLDTTESAPTTAIELQLCNANYYVDEWIWMQMNVCDAFLVLKTRQLFFNIYLRYLKHCGNPERWRRSHEILPDLELILDTFNKMLKQQDDSCGFKYPVDVGLRPKSLPGKFIAQFNKLLSWESPVAESANLETNWWRYREYEKEFFMVYYDERADISHTFYSISFLRESVAEVIVSTLAENKLTYVILYRKYPDQFTKIAVVRKRDDAVILIHCFKNKVQIYELINICTTNHIAIPPFNERIGVTKLDNRVGEVILDLFAFRNNWLHNN